MSPSKIFKDKSSSFAAYSLLSIRHFLYIAQNCRFFAKLNIICLCQVPSEVFCCLNSCLIAHFRNVNAFQQRYILCKFCSLRKEKEFAPWHPYQSHRFSELSDPPVTRPFFVVLFYSALSILRGICLRYSFAQLYRELVSLQLLYFS